MIELIMNFIFLNIEVSLKQLLSILN